jgi:DNA adenine methylase
LPAIGTEGSLIEPFAGSAVVSINAPHRQIIAADTNPDLINPSVITQHNGVRVVIPNHYTPTTRKLYSEAQIVAFDVQRNISCDRANRQKAQELIAVYAP